MVLRIAFDESKVFETATKAPYLVCIESFLPSELDLVMGKAPRKNLFSRKSDALILRN